MRHTMRRLVIFASCLGVGVCVDSAGGGSDVCWNTCVPVEWVGGGACARQVTWCSHGPWVGEDWVCSVVLLTVCCRPPHCVHTAFSTQASMAAPWWGDSAQRDPALSWLTGSLKDGCSLPPCSCTIETFRVTVQDIRGFLLYDSVPGWLHCRGLAL